MKLLKKAMQAAAAEAAEAAIKIEPKLEEKKSEVVRLPSVLSQFRFRADRPMIARAALRSIGASLNFSIIGLVAAHLRSLRYGETVPTSDEHYGHTLDQRNEIDHEVEGAEVEQQLREDQGFTAQMKPLELAARLKVIRDSCAVELAQHAGLRRNPLNGELYKNPFDLVSSVAESLTWQLKQPARINDSTVQSLSIALGIDEVSIRVMLEEQHQSQQKFLKENAAELYTIIDNLAYKGEDGHEMTVEDDETVEDRLPAINKARLFVAADKGLVSQRKLLVRSVGNGRRSIEDAASEFGLIDGEREMLRAKFHEFMKLPYIKDEIEEAVSRGARRPELLPLFQRIVVKKAA